jgi:hypothetical protein
MPPRDTETQSSLLERIIAWAQDLPLWQADAIRRLLQTGNLTKADKDEILLLLKADHGLIAEGVVPIGRRPQLGDISGASPGRERLVLCEIRSLQNVNAIPNGSSLPVKETGLTIVYGENGSGKSGYARVLKLACRARGSEKTTVLPNVFAKPAVSSGLASAEFVVRIGDSEPVALTWTDGKAGAEELTGVAFFDSDCARYTLDKENRPMYSPYGAFVFPELGALMRELKDILEREKPPEAPPETTDLDTESPAFRFASHLSATTTTLAIAEACSWSNDDANTLARIEADVAQLEAEDPVRLAALADGQKKRLDILADAIRKANTLLSDSSTEELAGKRRKLDEAETVLQAVRGSMAREPLPGVGSDEWRSLYDAAKEYSTKQAYPDRRFPFTEHDSRCVFCQQELHGDACARLERFRTFMEAKVTSDLNAAKATVVAAEKNLRELALPKTDEFADVFGWLRDSAPDATAEAIAYLAAAPSRRDEMLALVQTAAKSFPACPLDKIERIGAELGQRSKEYREKPKLDLLTDLRRKRTDLRSRKVLASRRAAVEKHVAALQQKSRLDACQRVLNPRAVTERHDVLVGEVLTQGLQACLRKELEDLGAPSCLAPIGTPRGGDTLLGLRLREGGVEIGCPPSDVLSEGEQRVVAIAGFLAELVASGHEGPIVFDDPVSSLDHIFKDRITQRMVREAAKRQILVFTHDIEFLLSAERHARDADVDMLAQFVYRESRVAGIRADGLPWHASNVKRRIGYLKNELARIKAMGVTDKATYNREAAGLYGLLRMTWERLVEERLFQDVVRRFSPAVQTNRLKKVMVSDEDYRTIEAAMTRCSKWTGHDAPQSADVNLPTPDSIACDITSLESYASQLDKRADVTAQAR